MSALHPVLSATEMTELLNVLKIRFANNMQRHQGMQWTEVEARLKASPAICVTLDSMERTGGEPDLLWKKGDEKLPFFDCAAESPKGRRSLCYDREGWESRKDARPEHTAIEMAAELGIELLDETAYRYLQQFGTFDSKTSSWLKTPKTIRRLGGAIFGDFRYGQIFIYHNGAGSYYAARGFRGKIEL